MQPFFNLLYNFISFLVNFLSFSPPEWFAQLVVGVVKYGTYAQYFVPVLTFFQVGFFCLSVHLLFMVAHLVLRFID